MASSFSIRDRNKKDAVDKEPWVSPEKLSKFDVLKILARERWWSWLVALFLCAAGIVLVVPSTAHWKPFDWMVEGLVRDLGIAALVAGILGIAVDVIAFGTDRAQREMMLQRQMDALVEWTERRQPVFDQHMDDVSAAVQYVRQHENPLQAISYLLAEAFPDRGYREFRVTVERLLDKVMQLHDLEQSQHNDREINLRPFVEFLSWTLNRHVLGMTSELEDIAGVVKYQRGRATCEYDAPGRYELNQQLLSAQMRSLLPGDRYDSLANFRLWTVAGRDKYEQATLLALRRGVNIRRIFNVADVSETKRNDARKAVRRQLSIFKKPGFDFSYRFLTRDVLDNADEEVRRAVTQANLSSVQDLDKVFYGLFYHENQTILLYRTQLGQSRHLTLSAAHVEESREVEAKYVDLFEALWHACDGIRDPFVGKAPKTKPPQDASGDRDAPAMDHSNGTSGSSEFAPSVGGTAAV